MDKIQELHHDKVQCLSGIIKTDVLASDHATITEDMMGRFTEWKDTQGYIPVPDGQGRIKHIKKHSQKHIEYTTSELITMFKQTL